MEYLKYDLEHYPQLQGSSCIKMTDAEFSAYIQEKRKEFEASHCRHGKRLNEECFYCKKEAGG